MTNRTAQKTHPAFLPGARSFPSEWPSAIKKLLRTKEEVLSDLHNDIHLAELILGWDDVCSLLVAELQSFQARFLAEAEASDEDR
jgi:hypothetical protein